MKKDKLIYKDFIGTVHFSTDDELFYGKIEGIDDLVTFEGVSVKELRLSFEAAVDDYLELCAQIGKEPFKSFKGSFNIRISPELHKKAFRFAVEEGVSLNQFIQQAVEHEINHKQYVHRSSPM
jgi:predicted HicB family RNase H-like nuclease